QAYLSTAKALRAQQDEASFTKAVRGLGLTEYASVSWHQRRIDNDQGRLEGAVTTKQGGVIPVTLTLVKEDGTWKVLSVTGPQGGVNSGAGLASARKTSQWPDDRGAPEAFTRLAMDCRPVGAPEGAIGALRNSPNGAAVHGQVMWAPGSVPLVPRSGTPGLVQ